MIELRTLETFYWVARLGGFRRAAEKLNTTQPAVSARIQQLEQAFNTRLIDRDKRHSALTPKGVELFAYAERMLALRTEMVMAVTEAGSLRGTVRLGLSETIVHTWLARLVKRLHERYPAITLEISVDVSANLRDALLAGELDIALLLGPISAPKIMNLPLCRYPMAWIASPDLSIGSGPVTLTELAAWPIMTYSRQTRPYREVTELFARVEIPRPRFFANSSLASIVRMTLDGIGISAIPPAVIPDELAAGRLRILASDTVLPPLAFTASYLDQPDNALAAIVARLAESVAIEEGHGP
ncbi:LysR family transcriptional regulator [Aliidongia dinghuensis]|uniref:LysR family transcriptional regulator n=1 Tax=Aliidongia dinghuensis TaxID=1867774 RepID=A0A8J2YXL8_9PROT|nr:LysR family transcriptional regulator [Aliidongia dinghuensis]GGF37181.1 LysR family transcriptional regulator [Aliidongia dinghuensis]